MATADFISPGRNTAPKGKREIGMDELNKGLEVALQGEVAGSIVKRVQRQVKEWGLALPDVEPLVLDFGLGNFDRIGEVEFWIANEAEAGYCGKFLFLFSGQTCPKHMHRQKVETFFIVKGRISMEHKGSASELRTGGVLKVDRTVYHEFKALEPSLVLEVSKPSIIDDNYFENTQIPIGGNSNK